MKQNKIIWVVVKTGKIYYNRKEAKKDLGASNFDRMNRLGEIRMQI